MTIPIRKNEQPITELLQEQIIFNEQLLTLTKHAGINIKLDIIRGKALNNQKKLKETYTLLKSDIPAISLEESLQDYELGLIQYNNGYSIESEYSTDKDVFKALLLHHLDIQNADIELNGREGYIRTPDLVSRDALEKLLSITTFLDMISNENQDELSIHFILNIEKE